MSAVRAEITVGAIVVAVAIGFVIYAGQMTGFASSTTGYPLSASFRSIEGVSIGTDVRLAGVRIGSVSKIALNPQTFRADTEMTIQQGIELPDDSTVVIASEGLLGGNFVEILPGGSPFNLESGAEIEDTQGSISLIGLMMKFVTGNGDEE